MREDDQEPQAEEMYLRTPERGEPIRSLAVTGSVMAAMVMAGFSMQVMQTLRGDSSKKSPVSSVDTETDSADNRIHPHRYGPFTVTIDSEEEGKESVSLDVCFVDEDALSIQVQGKIYRLQTLENAFNMDIQKMISMIHASGITDITPTPDGDFIIDIGSSCRLTFAKEDIGKILKELLDPASPQEHFSDVPFQSETKGMVTMFLPPNGKCTFGVKQIPQRKIDKSLAQVVQ